jgi:hypothetical protein
MRLRLVLALGLLVVPPVATQACSDTTFSSPLPVYIPSDGAPSEAGGDAGGGSDASQAGDTGPDAPGASDAVADAPGESGDAGDASEIDAGADGAGDAAHADAGDAAAHD